MSLKPEFSVGKYAVRITFDFSQVNLVFVPVLSSSQTYACRKTKLGQVVNARAPGM